MKINDIQALRNAVESIKRQQYSEIDRMIEKKIAFDAALESLGFVE